MRVGQLFTDLPTKVPEERVDILATGASVRIERIVSHGHRSPEGFWYDQDRHEWVAVLRGRAALEVDGEVEIVQMSPGDHVDIPAHRRHRVVWTDPDQPTLWLAVHYE